MKKNGFLTFVSACIPGAGAMYYGYMKRGLSLITLFCLSGALSSILSVFAVGMPIIWMYSFFDTYDIVRRLIAGEALADELLFTRRDGAFFRLLPNQNKAIGWVLVGLGVWAIYQSVLSPLLEKLLSALGVQDPWQILNNIPTVAVAVLLIWGGVWLVGGRRNASGAPSAEELPRYPHGQG